MAMNDETVAPAAKRRRKMPAAKRRKTTKEKVPDMPYELLSDILLRLPIKSLMRLKCVCKAWRNIISEDPSFLHAHLSIQRRQRPHVLIAPQGKGPNRERLYDTVSLNKVTTIGLYRWEAYLGWATLLNDLESFPAAVTHEFAHCDGLVLVPTDDTMRLINPATQRVLPLPLSPRSACPRKLPCRLASHQAFGLGLDPRTRVAKIPNGVLVLHLSPKFPRRYKLQSPEAYAVDETDMLGLMYQDTEELGYLTEAIIDFDVIPYISTIVPI